MSVIIAKINLNSGALSVCPVNLPIARRAREKQKGYFHSLPVSVRMNPVLLCLSVVAAVVRVVTPVIALPAVHNKLRVI
jgi:hypothetical protein